MSTAVDTSAGLWPSMAQPPTVTVAVLAATQARAQLIADFLDRDGLLVTLTSTGASAISPDLLAPQLDSIVLDAEADEDETEHAVRAIRNTLDRAGIVVICPPSQGRRVPHYLKRGADAVIFADDLELTLASVVRCAVAGQISVPRSMRDLLVPPALSYREKQVLGLADRGLTNRQIAGMLFLAESTVKAHLSSAFRRLGVNSRREAMAVMSATGSQTRAGLVPGWPVASGSPPIPGSTQDREPASRKQA